MDETSTILAQESTLAYKLRVAESDGSQDDDLPALENKSSIKRLGFDTFVLTMNPSYKPEEKRERSVFL